MSGSFTSVRIGGGLLPPDVLASVLAGSLDGLKSGDYHLGGESPREAAARVWTHLLGVHRRFRDDLSRLPEGDPAVGVTRERWLTQLLNELGYGRVPLTGPGGITVDERQYPVSHLWGATPIHLLGWGVPLDRRTAGVPGAAHRAPHAMVQELLNRTDTYLWGIVSNGRVLRLLRDSTTLTGQAYVEFDLEAMFDGELFAEFALLYLVVHQSRVETSPHGVPTDCWLERWRTTAVSQGVRALTLLRDGVQQAIETLGTGVLQHPANAALRTGLDGGAIRLEDLHSSLLRTVYRLLFWAVAEERDALLEPDAPQVARDRYRQHFSSGRLRRLAVRRHGSAHDDLWEASKLVLTALGREEGEPRLAIPGLGGLFSSTATDVLADARLGNQPLLSAIRHLSVVQPKGQPRRLVDFRHLGAEELGSIYESLLELVPRHDPVRHTFTLETLAGNERKTSGSYYTPTELVELVLDMALDPVLDDAEKQSDPESALLAVTACDPSIGSGHFMVAAARRIANRLAMVRTGEVDPTPTDAQAAMHDVVARCIYGVDLNPMAADLAKVSLWLEAMAPGRPLSFLDHHIKVGNALLGTTPALLHAGIPDTAYVALAGDDKKTITAWKKLNSQQRGGQADLFTDAGIPVGNASERVAAQDVAARAANAQTLADISWAAQRYAAEHSSERAVRTRRVADAWCAAFLGSKTPDDEPITHATLEQVGGGTAPQHVNDTVDALATRHRLFHWHLEFPEVFRVPDGGPANTPSGWVGGFTAVLGNPPWETLQMSEKEFFASRDTTIAGARTAALRKRAIAALADTDPSLLDEFMFASRRGAAETHLIRASNRFPLCATGKINTYSIFAEHFRMITAPAGRLGVLTPSGLGTGDTTSAFISDVLRSAQLAAFFDFANHKRRLFDGLKGQSWFALTVLTGGERVEEARVAFDLAGPDEVARAAFTVSRDEILLLNPNTGTLPVCRTRRDVEITLACYRAHPVLLREGPAPSNPWELRFSQGLFNMASDSSNFETAQDLESHGATFQGWEWRVQSESWLPLYEAKMLNLYNHRFGTYHGYDIRDGTGIRAIPTPTADQLDDPGFEPLARYWVNERDVEQAVPEFWDRDWFLGWRDITNVTNERTFVPSVLPKTAVGHVFPVVVMSEARQAPLLQAAWSSLVLDYVARQKLSGTHMTYGVVHQLATPAPTSFAESPGWCESTLASFVRARVLELTFTSTRIRPYAQDVVGGDPGEPFRWLPERRHQIRAELDAAMLHLYGLDRDDAGHILDSFFVLRRYEERDQGEFRTKRLVLAAYDAMTKAAATGVPFRSPLDPPPGEGPRHTRSRS
jgi:hypothetical protein